MTTSSAATIFVARKVITLDACRPLAGAVAVRDGRILGVGSVEELAGWGAYRLDTTFADKVLLPGFVEAHGHAQGEGLNWRTAYVGYHDRRAPDGQVVAGSR